MGWPTTAKGMRWSSSTADRVRTLSSPLCRSTIRPKVFHGTNSITCASSVLPTFMPHLGHFEPEGPARQRIEIQIVDTRKPP